MKESNESGRAQFFANGNGRVTLMVSSNDFRCHVEFSVDEARELQGTMRKAISGALEQDARIRAAEFGKPRAVEC